MKRRSDFCGLVQGFFVDWLTAGRNVSPRTVSAYRDAFVLLIRWLSKSLALPADKLTLAHLTLPAVEGFLRYLAQERGNCAGTVNARLAAIKSFCRYASYRAPEAVGEFERIISIPKKKEAVHELAYLDAREVGWLVSACPAGTDAGRSTRLLIRLLYNSGARISELLALRAGDIEVADGGKCRISILGKGRKERCLPLWRETAEELAAMVSDKGLGPCDFVFSGRNVEHLTRSGARSRIDAAAKAARLRHPSLAGKAITPHVFRHSTAMAMLAAGVDIATIAIWLGHESIQTTHRYMVSDMKLKEEAIEKARLDWGAGRQARYKAGAEVLRFLESL